MYQKYQTDALALGSRERGKADRVFALYTRDFGLVWARASGVRRENSKMRYALQSGAYIQTGLVRGRRGWRLAGAGATRPLPGKAAGAPVFARMSALVLRLVHGEEKNEYLFDTLVNAQTSLIGATHTILPTVEIV